MQENEQNKETVKEFVEKISSNDFFGDEVKVLIGADRDEFINKYLVEMRKLLKTRFEGVKTAEEIEQTIKYLENNLKRNIKYIIDVTYTEEEKAIREQFDIAKINAEKDVMKEIEQSETYKSYRSKHDIGAGPGGYIQGRLIFSNLLEDDEKEGILKAHETNHASMAVILNRETKESVIQNCDEFDTQEIVRNPDGSIASNDECISSNYKGQAIIASAGYDKLEVDENGFCLNEKGEVLIRNQNDEMYKIRTDLMEMCTEGLADLMKGYQDKSKIRKFKNFWIPTREMKMSAISYDRDTRDYLIMAIGSDEFMFDMLEEDRNKGIEKLNKIMQEYKSDSSIWGYLKAAREYYKCSTRVEAGATNESYNKENLPKLKEDFENYVIDIFLSRMEKYQEKDKQEQIEYFESIIGKEKITKRIQELQKEKQNAKQPKTYQNISTQSLGKQTYDEQKDTVFLDNLEEEMFKQEKNINHEINEQSR